MNSAERKTWPLRLWSDPFYYAIRLPSVGILILFSLLLLAVLSLGMVLVWIVVKWIALGSFPSFQGQPVKMFMASAAIAAYILLAGIIHRRMTMPHVRGRFVSFSNTLYLKNGLLTFSLVDKHETQLIGTKLVVEIATIDKSDNLLARRLELDSPGILALPTEITVPICEIFPSLRANNFFCQICGKSQFSSSKAHVSHMSFFHGADPEKEEELTSLPSIFEEIEILRVVLTGTDEMSGKSGLAVKEYLRSDIEMMPAEDPKYFEIYEETDEDTENISDEESLVTSTPSSKPSVVHIDFKYH